MKFLTELSPAEASLLVNGETVQSNELLKLTFMDLLIRQVLQIIELEKQPDRFQPKRVYKYVVPGKRFLTHEPRAFEEVYLSPFRKSAGAQILVKHMVKVGFQNAISGARYKSNVFESLRDKGLLSRNFFQRLTGRFSFTSEGRDKSEKVKKEIEALEKELSFALVMDKQRAQTILKAIGGNVLLLKGIDLAAVQQLDMEIYATMKNPRDRETASTADYDLGYGYAGFAGITFFSDSFDSGCSGFGDSGCSGSGCGGSGCSGCGGGCGGGGD
jgi:hypothetical protein